MRSQQQRIQDRAQSKRDSEPYSVGTTSFANYKAGMTGFVKTMAQPANLPEAEETVVQQSKLLASKGFEEAMECLSGQQLAYSNLTSSELKGRQQVLKGIKEQGWHLSETDKSKKLVLDLAENYTRTLSLHTVRDKKVRFQ